MNPFTKNAVIAGLVALVVALGVVLGARAISPAENSGVTLKVTAPDGSVIGTTEPVKMASSGPPVPACSVVNTKLNCQGPGLPFDWTAVTFPGDSGLNEAFGTIVAGNYNLDAGIQAIAVATITPQVTGELSITGTVTMPFPNDSGPCTSNASLVAGCTTHPIGDASTYTWISNGLLGCLPTSAGANFVDGSGGPFDNIYGGLGGTISGLEAGTAEDCFLFLAPSSGTTYTVLNGSIGGIWVHESP